jgi:hypothetical protein
MSRMPPIPPASRSKKGPVEAPKVTVDEEASGTEPPPENLEQQDQQGNTFQNTRHQGGRQAR